MTEPRAVKPGTIQALVLPGAPDDVDRLIRPCRPQRQWMERTPASYAFRCTPLSGANTMGWEILNPVACEVRWNGMTPHTQLAVWREREVRFGPKSHFGSGVVTWELPFLFRTPPDWGMAVSGPANADAPNGIVPLDGFIRTDWLPFPFTMNWRVTEADRTIRFEAGVPIARVYPYPLALLDEVRLELRDWNEDPVFTRQFEEWGEQRQRNYAERQRIGSGAAGEEPDREALWSRRYARGEGAGEDRRHQTVFRCRPAVDRRRSDDD